MNKHLTTALSLGKRTVKEIALYHRDLPKTQKMVAFFLEALFVFGAAYFILHANNSQIKTNEDITSIKEVRVAKVIDLTNRQENTPLLGTVVSINEATIRSESSGKITKVYKSLGDAVSVGDIIAEFDNSQERASLLQAEGAYDAARAAKDISSISGSNSTLQLAEAKNGALNTLNSTYNTLDDVIRVKTDVAFSDPRTNDAKLILSTPDAALVYSLEERRKAIENTLKARDEKNRSLSSESDLATELTNIEKEAQFIKIYLDDLAKAYSKSLANGQVSDAVLTSSKAVVSTARSQVSQTISQIQTSRSTLNSSVANKNISEKTSGGGAVTSSDAQVKQALGAYEAALARYQKTIIRSPLSGTINSLSVKTGDYVATFSQIGVISNNGSLEVKTYLNEDEAPGVRVGATSTIYKGASAYKGKVTKVAEAFDPLTKKIEMRVALLDTTAKEIVNGESVTLTVEKSDLHLSKNTTLQIPLSSLKMTSTGATVFFVVDGKTIQKPIKEGAIYGDMIEVKSGLLGDDIIIIDARGLKNDMSVTVK